jgi:hypothetical protein
MLKTEPMETLVTIKFCFLALVFSKKCLNRCPSLSLCQTSSEHVSARGACVLVHVPKPIKSKDSVDFCIDV